MAFKNPMRVPPGGQYFYAVVVGDDIFRFTDRSHVGLLDRIKSWYVLRGETPPDNLWQLCQVYMCQFLPKGFCWGSGGGAAIVTAHAVKTKALPYLTRPVAPAGTIRERLQTCVGCAKNDRSMCTTCLGLTSWALTGLRRPRVALDDYAGICRCDNLMISVAASLAEPPTASGADPVCWRGVPNG